MLTVIYAGLIELLTLMSRCYVHDTFSYIINYFARVRIVNPLIELIKIYECASDIPGMVIGMLSPCKLKYVANNLVNTIVRA
jgi:hypothetical protein